MDTTWLDLAAESGALAVGLIVAGVVVVALLLGAFVFGAWVRRRELPPPRAEEQPRLPEDGPVREVLENREPDEVPRSEHRMTPHEMPALGNIPSRPSPARGRRRWNEGGSGGPGRT